MNNELKQQIAASKDILEKQYIQLKDKAEILKSNEFKKMYQQLGQLPVEDKAKFGLAVNELKNSFKIRAEQANDGISNSHQVDLSAPYDVNCPKDLRPKLLAADNSSLHPLNDETKLIVNIFVSMGYEPVLSREIDDDWHMFGSLNFPEGHPARDDYDTFMTTQTDKRSKPLIAPAHTSTMQTRMLLHNKANLEHNQPIANIMYGRVFRNEDVDARHEHTFNQIEGFYVSRNVSIGNLVSTLKDFLQAYYQQELKVKTQPFYFPFTEPSLEFACSCPFCQQAGCHICSNSGWIELLGCGMIHPNVLDNADVDASKYNGFAFGIGIERLVMLKYGIDDIRYFNSGKLEFLKLFKGNVVI